MAFEPTYIEGLTPTDIEIVCANFTAFTSDQRDQLIAAFTALLGPGATVKADYDGSAQNPKTAHLDKTRKQRDTGIIGIDGNRAGIDGTGRRFTVDGQGNRVTDGTFGTTPSVTGQRSHSVTPQDGFTPVNPRPLNPDVANPVFPTSTSFDPGNPFTPNTPVNPYDPATVGIRTNPDAYVGANPRQADVADPRYSQSAEFDPANPDINTFTEVRN